MNEKKRRKVMKKLAEIIIETEGKVGKCSGIADTGERASLNSFF